MGIIISYPHFGSQTSYVSICKHCIIATLPYAMGTQCDDSDTHPFAATNINNI